MRTLLITVWLCFAVTGHAQEAPEQWGLVEELRIGSVDGPNALSSIHALLVSPEGREIYVGQHRENIIRVYDAVSGRPIRTIGRRGQGPGEFNWLLEMGWMGDTLVVKDRALRRMTLLSPDGQHLRTEPFPTTPVPGAIGWAIPITYLANGTIVGLTNTAMLEVLAGRIQTARWVQMTRDGALLRTLAERDLRGDYGQMLVGDRGFTFGQPMSETVFLRVAPNGSTFVIVRAEPTLDPDARIHVTRLGMGGDTIYNRSYRYTPRPMTPSLREAAYRPYLRDVGRAVPVARARQLVEENVKLPPAMPPVTSLTVGSDGTVWMGRGEFQGDSRRWVVLDPAGNVRATVQGATRVDVKAVMGDVAWATVTGEFDVPYVVRYRVRPVR